MLVDENKLVCMLLLHFSCFVRVFLCINYTSRPVTYTHNGLTSLMTF